MSDTPSNSGGADSTSQTRTPATAASGPASAVSAAAALPVATARGLLVLACVMLGLTLVAAIVCTFIGHEGFVAPLQSFSPFQFDVIWLSRLSRIVVAAIVGAALAAAGLAFQGLLRNPLADPYVLGVSSGAGVGYLAGQIVASAWGVAAIATTPLLCLAGAVGACLTVYLLAQRRGRLDPYVLLLAGVIVNVINGAVILTLLLFLRSESIVEYVNWGIGQIRDGLLRTDTALVAVCAAGVVGGWCFLLIRAGAMNVLGLGDEVASSSGVGVHALRIETFLLASLMTAAAVALSGPIGFVGLIIPHICRFLAGPDHRRLSILTGFAGAIFLMAADTFCRAAGGWIHKAQIPLGVVTAVVGGPVFILLLRRRGREAR